jgi:BirA family biotin operon repressor/biotin-[acetyl-CoA-carboxylase] ligase
MPEPDDQFQTTPMAGRPGPPSAFSVRRILAETDMRHVEYHPVLASTSDTARELLTDLLSVAPAVVLADSQTAGRGRQGKTWATTSGALTFSVVIDPQSVALPPDRRPLIALAAGSAVHDVIAHQLPDADVRIKWPNDVLINQQKVCGILIEQHTSASRSGIVIGIGVNVNNSFRTADDELRHTATALIDALDVPPQPEELLIAILQALMKRLGQLHVRLPQLLSEVNAVHAMNQHRVTVDQSGNIFSGLCHGIDDGGCLVLQDETDQIHRLRSGTVVRWVPD